MLGSLILYVLIAIIIVDVVVTGGEIIRTIWNSVKKIISKVKGE